MIFFLMGRFYALFYCYKHLHSKGRNENQRILQQLEPQRIPSIQKLEVLLLSEGNVLGSG